MKRILIIMFGYMIQVFAAISDVIILAMAVILLSYAMVSGDILIIVGSIGLVLAAYETWKSQGMFIAWTHSKQFISNWKKMNGIN